MKRESLRGESIYSVYIRNFSVEGDISSLIKRLDYIKELGATVVWIMPHYEIGEINRKGKLGSPYAIKDYKSVNKEYGNIDNFKELINRCHDLNLKLIIDIVFNHTSCDSNLLNSNPEWFITINDELISKVPQWSDVVDLDYTNKELFDYLIEVLKYWVELGVDGFRCDVASVVPLDFWLKARRELNSLKDNLIWLAESVDKEFISFIRHKGYSCHSDSELYNAFDILYDYDINWAQEEYIDGHITFNEFVRELSNQEVVYPADYLKLRFLENHDSKNRIAKVIKDVYHLKNWKAFSIFQKGIPLIYNGEEIMAKKLPDLFNKDSIKWENNHDYMEFIKKLLKINKLEIVKKGIYFINPLIEDCVHLRYRDDGETLHGFFNLGRKNRNIPVEALEGKYINQIDDEEIIITEKGLNLSKAPYIFKSIP